MRNVISITHIRGFHFHNNLRKLKKNTPHLIVKVDHVIMCEKNFNTKKCMDVSYNFFLLSLIMHLITLQHFFSNKIFHLQNKFEKVEKKLQNIMKIESLKIFQAT